MKKLIISALLIVFGSVYALAQDTEMAMEADTEMAMEADTEMAMEAAPSVAISGTAKMGLQRDGGAASTIGEYDVKFASSGVTDGGLTFGASITIDSRDSNSITGDGFAAYVGSADGSWKLQIGDNDAGITTASAGFGRADPDGDNVFSSTRRFVRVIRPGVPAVQGRPGVLGTANVPTTVEEGTANVPTTVEEGTANVPTTVEEGTAGTPYSPGTESTTQMGELAGGTFVVTFNDEGTPTLGTPVADLENGLSQDTVTDLTAENVVIIGTTMITYDVSNEETSTPTRYAALSAADLELKVAEDNSYYWVYTGSDDPRTSEEEDDFDEELRIYRHSTWLTDIDGSGAIEATEKRFTFDITKSRGFVEADDGTAVTMGTPNVPTTGTTGTPNVPTTGTTGTPNVPTTGTTGTPNVPTTGTTGTPNVPTTPGTPYIPGRPAVTEVIPYNDSVIALSGSAGPVNFSVTSGIGLNRGWSAGVNYDAGVFKVGLGMNSLDVVTASVSGGEGVASGFSYEAIYVRRSTAASTTDSGSTILGYNATALGLSVGYATGGSDFGLTYSRISGDSDNGNNITENANEIEFRYNYDLGGGLGFYTEFDRIASADGNRTITTNGIKTGILMKF